MQKLASKTVEISLQPAFGYRSGRHRMSMGARLVDDDDNVDRVVEDSDSDAELDHAPVLEAKRVQRRIPNNTLPCRETPFYSELVEPKMSLGDEWPRRNQTRGFRRVLPGGYKAPLVCSPAGQVTTVHILFVLIFIHIYFHEILV